MIGTLIEQNFVIAGILAFGDMAKNDG